MRQPLKRLFVTVTRPSTRGCMQVAKREYNRTGRDPSSASRRSISQTSLRRRVRFHRLRVDQLLGYFIAVARIVPLGAANVVLIEFLVRIIEPTRGDLTPELVILAHH